MPSNAAISAFQRARASAGKASETWSSRVPASTILDHCAASTGFTAGSLVRRKP